MNAKTRKCARTYAHIHKTHIFVIVFVFPPRERFHSHTHSARTHVLSPAHHGCELARYDGGRDGFFVIIPRV